MDTQSRGAIRQNKAPGAIPGALFHALCLIVWCFTSGISDAQPYFSKSIDLGQNKRERIKQFVVIDSSIYVSTGQVCQDGDCTTLVHMDLEGHILNQRLFTWLDGGDQEYLIHDDGFVIMSGHDPHGVYAQYIVQVCDLNLDSLISTQYTVIDTVEVLANKSIITYGDYYVLMGFTILDIKPSVSHLFWINRSDFSLDTIIEINLGDVFTSLNEASIDATGLLNIHFEYFNQSEIGRHRGLLRYNQSKKLISMVDAPFQNEGPIFENHLILTNGNVIIMEQDITDYELVFLSPEGDYITTTQIQSTIYEAKPVSQIILAKNGDIIGCGQSLATRTDTFDFYIATGFVFRMSQSGELLWDRKIVEFDSTGNPKLAAFHDVMELPNGDIVLGGGIEDLSIPGNKDMWLVRIDSNGCITPDCEDFQIITAIDDPSETVNSTLIRIAPNPFSETLHIELNSNFDLHHSFLQVNSLSGSIVLSQIVSDDNAIDFDTSSLPSGVYFVTLRQDGKIVATQKIIKQ